MSKILVVDDDPSVRTLLRLIFELAGYEVMAAAHGKAALDLIRDAQLPDIVTTDLMMPVMNGNEFILRLRSDTRTTSIPIVVVSANAEAAEGAQAAVRADALLSKPFVPAQLVKLVQSFDVGTSIRSGQPLPRHAQDRVTARLPARRLTHRSKTLTSGR